MVYDTQQKQIVLLLQIHLYAYSQVFASQQKKPLGVIRYYVHCSLQLSLELESFYLPIMKLYGFIHNGALRGNLFYEEIFYRLIFTSFLAHACSINSDMISLRDIKTTAASLSLHTARSEFRVPKPQSCLWSPGKQASLSSKDPDLLRHIV